MPRTKQIHPRNLRDKIEEAQKKLNTPEDPPKESFAAGSPTCSDTIKGVKRKKIVTENHLKKIPKSPLKNVSKEKQRHLETYNSLSTTISGSGPSNDKELVQVQICKQNKETNSELLARSVKSDISMQGKKLSVPPDLCNGQGETFGSGSNMTLLKESSTSTSLSINHKKANIASENTAKQYSCANTAFDVLLKAMEPELNTLNQSRPPCGTQMEKQGHKTPAPLVAHTSSRVSSTSQQELSSKYMNYYRSGQSIQPCTSAKGSPQAQVFSGSEEEHHHQTPSACSSFSSVLDVLKPQQVYHVAVTSVVNSSTSTATQGLSFTGSSSLSNPSNVSLNSSYNVTQVASLITREQICNIVLKDQKPKKQGKYICEYCNRACAKPSVLLKHIRSHTGERPYPCVTCGFSFKTKSNLYKHKKSHAHAIKLGLGLRSDSPGMLLSNDSEKALFISSDVDESGDSDEEYTSEERQDDQSVPGNPELPEKVKMPSGSNTVKSTQGRSSPSSPIAMLQDDSVQEIQAEAKLAELPKVIVYPVSVSPLRADSPKVMGSASEHFISQAPELKAKNKAPNLVLRMCSLSEVDQSAKKMCELAQAENKLPTNITAHAQLQRQQATDCSQEQQSKALLSPRSLGSTDSGYFSRSESADQAMSSPSPFLKCLPSSDRDFPKNVSSVAHTGVPGAIMAQPVCVEKPPATAGVMRPPLGTKSLEERISKLISDNEALVDDKQLDSVKPRRTSLSRRGSIDSPKSYIFKDSFQFDLKPVGRRTSSSSDIPKSPFTPSEKSKQVFFLSVPSQYPSIESLPITRSNSMPTTGYSAIPTVIPSSHPLRGSHSFDDKIGLYDDVFISGPSTPQQTVHPRTLVRQSAVEDSSTAELCGLGPARSVDESYPAGRSLQDVLLPRSKPILQGSSLDKVKKTHQGRGTMFECETCRNRYRKLENFENHKKFYCSELHGPKSKTVARETEHITTPNISHPQILHYRVASSTGTLEQPLLIRKRRKMKSVGDDDDPQQNEFRPSPETQDPFKSVSSTKTLSTITVLGSQSCTISTLSPQMQLISRSTELNTDIKIPTIEKSPHIGLKEKVDLKCQGTGISVIQHTNSLSRPSSFEKIESIERVSPVPFYELQKSNLKNLLSAIGSVLEKRSILAPQSSSSQSVEVSKTEVLESQHSILPERTSLVPQSRLVRQHNIQVPEILVTEEPDKDPEIQINDQDPPEKFTWPQRSGSLSSLPTEKLPPKKKRIRLSDLDNSSAESSFESTVSRSLSHESSLSRASSFSASFEKEEFSKSDSFSKTDSINKSSEFLTIPSGLNAFGAPREMRRAASEQINCTQPSMEAVEYRSKSFDCGSMSRSRSMSPTNTTTSRSSLVCSTNSGHIPLLERRRGPLVKQISLNIAETNVSQGKINILHSEHSILSQQSLHTINRPRTQVFSKDATKQKSVTDQHFPSENLMLAHTKFTSCSSSTNTTNINLFKSEVTTGLKSAKKGEKEMNMSSNLSEDRFAPKYQLECQKVKEKLFCSMNSSTIMFTNGSSADSILNSTSLNVKSDVKDSIGNISSNWQKQNKLLSNLQSSQSIVVPVHNYSNSLYYGFSAAVALPEILVTQDQGNQMVCKSMSVPLHSTREIKSTAKHQEEPNKPLPGHLKIYENCVPQASPQKGPATGLVPQQETSASSKRMLSPANSLDIAMEKQQKRVKDESGAACNSSSQQVNLLSMKTVEPGKQRKPMLVRQFCTSDPGESLDLDVSPGKYSPENRSPDIQLANYHSNKLPVSDVKEVAEYENKSLESSYPTVRMSPEPSQTSTMKSTFSNQERLSPVSTKNIHIQGQTKLGAAISVVNAGDMHRLSFPSLKTSTSFTWCYLLKRKPMHLPQNDQKTSAYASWTISAINPNPLGLPTKVALSLLNSKQKGEKFLFTLVKTSHARRDIIVYSSKWKNNSNKSSHDKSSTSHLDSQKGSESNNDQDKEPFQNRSEPRRVKIFDGGYKSNEEYVYVRGRGRGKYICEECGIRCKKPSMLKKHIRTHTDVRPYHCNYCNFSFKTKGNLTKHMKSKAHSKKCIDMGIAVGPIDDQDTDDSGEKQRYSGERSGFDGEDSDGAEDDDNDNEDEDEDSQAESVLSATPSVTASPQHYPFRNSQQEASSTDEDIRVPHCFSQSNSMDILPKALITRMTALTTATICKPEKHDGKNDTILLQKASLLQSDTFPPKSLCHKMSVDYPEAEEEPDESVKAKNLTISSDSSSVNTPPSPVDRSTQTMESFVTDSVIPQQKSADATQQTTQVTAVPTHLFSHLPLHSQHPVRSPYSMIPVGGIQLVPAGLTAYSTFVPFPAGQVQLTIPAVGVIHRTAGDKPTEVPSTPNPIGVADVNGVVPCIPIGQLNLPAHSTTSLQPLQPLSMETVNILGLSNTSIVPQIHPSGLTLNAVGLQVLATSPAPQSNPSPQTHIPGLQILNIALPTLISSISPLPVDSQGVLDKSPPCSTATGPNSASLPGNNTKQSESPNVSSQIQGSLKSSTDAAAREQTGTSCSKDTVRESQQKRDPNFSSGSAKQDPYLKIHPQISSRSPATQTLPPLRHQRRTELISRQSTVLFSDSSSDDDEGKLFIATFNEQC